MGQARPPILAFAPGRWTSIPAPSRRELAKLTITRPVLVLEAPEPIEMGGREFWELSRLDSDLIVCTPRVAGPSAFANSGKRRVRMVRALLHWFEIDAFVAWLYEPSALAFVRALSPSLMIEDRSFEAWHPSVMAELAASAAAALAEAEDTGARS